MARYNAEREKREKKIWDDAIKELVVLCDEYQNQKDGFLGADEFLDEVNDILFKYPLWPFETRLIEHNVLQGLSETSIALFYFLCGAFCKQFVKPVAESENEFIQMLVKYGIRSLIERNLVSVVKQDTGESAKESYIISVYSASLLFKGQRQIIDVGMLSSFGTFFGHEDIKRKELAFPKGMQQQLSRLLAATRIDKYKDIIQKMQDSGLRNSLTMLFYGPPGTGKTEFAMQLAAKNRLDLFSVDSAKMDGTRFGEGPRALRDMFRAFAYCSAISDCPPIMFWDEADAILSKRMTVSNASDREANTEINIILEELNHFSGILIAATNHMDNISSAMFRRFLFKVEFPIPDANTRAKIWKSKLPWLQDDEVHTIAERYPFSGGLMDNVATICLLESVLTGKNPSLSFILRQCEGQQVGVEKPGPKIGFKYNNKV